jgi:hypothetical protein
MITSSVLTQWSRVLLEKLTVSQLFREFVAFYGTQRFITAFTGAHHPSVFILYFEHIMAGA